MNVTESLIPQLLKAWASHLPAIIAFIAALIVIMVKWRQAPRASLLAMIGVLLNLLVAVVMPAVYVWMPRAFMQSNEPGYAERLGLAFLILNVVGSVLYAASFLLVFAAVYTGRRSGDSVQGQ